MSLQMTDLRMQLDLRALVDDMIREGWEVVSRWPLLVVERRNVRREIRPVGTEHVLITL